MQGGSKKTMPRIQMEGGSKKTMPRNRQMESRLGKMDPTEFTNLILKRIRYSNSSEEISRVLKMRPDADYERILPVFFQRIEYFKMHDQDYEKTALFLLRKTKNPISTLSFLFCLDSEKLVKEIIKNHRIDIHEKIFSSRPRTLLNYLFEKYCYSKQTSHPEDVKKYTNILKLLIAYYDLDANNVENQLVKDRALIHRYRDVCLPEFLKLFSAAAKHQASAQEKTEHLWLRRYLHLKEKGILQ